MLSSGISSRVVYKDYYLASSVGGQMNEILRCDWLPERARESSPACSGLPAASRKKSFPESHIINPLLTKLVRSRWLDNGLVLFKRKISSHLDRTNVVNNPYILFVPNGGYRLYMVIVLRIRRLLAVLYLNGVL